MSRALIPSWVLLCCFALAPVLLFGGLVLGHFHGTRANTLAAAAFAEYEPTNIGSGIYEFDQAIEVSYGISQNRGARFSELLARFIQQHPDLRVTAIGGNRDGFKIVVVTEPRG